MKLSITTFTLLAGLSLSACGSAPAPQQTLADDLDWLIGCWATEQGTVEDWSSSDMNTLLGEGRSPRSDGTVFTEYLTISRNKDELYYLAAPTGTEPIMFTASERGAGMAVFENPDHDYPQRISYQRNGDTLSATISLMAGERSNQWIFAPCAD
ncbi:DUF6265 family protein [Ponticaulis sp.]|uniref:DUF6265 family protein n=1 Tax=Ponticaulis sp. TaxID=2020902 RepID=UPI000B630DF0|nr:DUF6265 family protein [Ponticaulis sp.]MAI91814.1 hypothetical protein [Ponticaulis sp.]OUX96685.1 MAG: hypothetical protein CBB65_15395 [Hyphomonadaceae bacterium TMED5]|tara:strand:+ start:9335 stop:9796 length:462 start_codon:yes stop_codon:yes gene_type:complete